MIKSILACFHFQDKTHQSACVLLLWIKHDWSILAVTHVIEIAHTGENMIETELVCDCNTVRVEQEFLCQVKISVHKFLINHTIQCFKTLGVFFSSILQQCVDQRSSNNSFLDVIEAGLSKDSLILSKVKNIVMDLESDSQMCTEVKHSTLVLQVEMVDQGDATAAERYHTRCFVVSLGDVLRKVFLRVNSEIALVDIDFIRSKFALGL